MTTLVPSTPLADARTNGMVLVPGGEFLMGAEDDRVVPEDGEGPADFPDTRAVVEAPSWRQVYGACRRHPEGPGSDGDDRAEHPVVHVSWNDAAAYAAWAGKRLPTEAGWEYAARGGLEQRADGWYGTAPVTAYPPNGYGLHNMCGNVWEWCADRYSPASYAHGPKAGPRGPSFGVQRVIRGGSYLCHASCCRRYRDDAPAGAR